MRYKIGAEPTSNDDVTGSLEVDGPLTIEVSEEGEHTVYVWLEDGEGNADYTQRSEAIVRYDATSPEIALTPVTSQTLGRELSLDLDITDVSGAAAVTLYYRLGGESDYRALDVAADDDGGFTAAIPGDMVGYRGLDYYVEALDAAGNLRRVHDTGEGQAYGVQVTFQDFVADTALPTHTWGMVSVPALPDQGAPLDVLAALGGYDIYQWRLYRFFNGRYREFTQEEVGEFEPGWAFWLHSRMSDVRMRSGGGQTVAIDEPYEIRLDPDWNDIGVPYAFPVRWEDIMAASGDPAGVAGPYGYDGTGWSFPDPADILFPWEGYAVKNSNDDDVTLKIPAIASVGTGKAVANQWRGTPAGQVDWVLQIRATAASVRDVSNYLGLHAGASTERDRWDLPEPPPAPGAHIRLFFPHEEWTEYPDVYTSDFRPAPGDGAVWDFLVEGSLAGMPARLSFEGTGHLPAGMNAQLLDADGRVSVDLSDGLEYPVTLEGAGTRRHLRVAIGNDDFLREAAVDYLDRPDGYSLEQNRPNPFNAQTSISYQIPESRPVRLRVFDILGQHVATLVDGFRDPGHFSVAWDGRDGQGREASSGVYFYLLEVPGTRLVQRMTLVR